MLRSFLSKGQSATLAALTAFTKLAINDRHKSSLHEQFDKELQVAAKSKKFSEFKERCFRLLGYTAASVLYHMEKFKNVLQNPRSNNLLVQACNLYINTDFTTMALQRLAWFTHKIQCVRDKKAFLTSINFATTEE